MPTSSLQQRFNKLRQHKSFTVGDLCTLAHSYQVSFEALINRLESLRLLSTTEAVAILKAGIKVRQVKNELGLEDIPTNAGIYPIRYQHLALEALQNDLVGEAQFAKLMGMDRLRAREFAQSMDMEAPNESSQISNLNHAELVAA